MMMKHYYIKKAHSDWVSMFNGLVTTMSFPRALIFCDNDRIDRYLEEMLAMGIAVSANLPGSSSESRQKALQDFTSNRTQFLLTHSEPAVCQILLPKVSCVFHFGIPSQTAAVYVSGSCPLTKRLLRTVFRLFWSTRTGAQKMVQCLRRCQKLKKDLVYPSWKCQQNSLQLRNIHAL